MDPITLILTALAAGATASIKDTSGQAIKDSYNGLKALIQRKFRDQPKAQTVFVDYQDDPETYEKPLKKALMEAQVDQEKDIIEAAQKVMTLVQPQQAAMSKYNVQITGNVQGYAQGDKQQVTMHFGNKTKE